MYAATPMLMNHPFPAAFAPYHAEALSRLATQIEFRSGETIFRQREVADGFYLIEKGEISLEYEVPGKRRVKIQSIGPGELLGLSWLFEPYRWEFSATAISGGTAKFLRATEVRKECEQDAKLGYKLMEEIARVLTQRLQATRHKLLVFVERASEDDDARQVC